MVIDNESLLKKKSIYSMVENSERVNDDELQSSYWVTAVAAVLASASLLVLLAIAWLFVEDSKSGRPSIFNCCYTICPEERDSDRRRLIDDREIPEKAPLPLKSCLISGGARGEKKSVSIDGCKFPEKVSLASQQRRNVG